GGEEHPEEHQLAGEEDPHPERVGAVLLLEGVEVLGELGRAVGGGLDGERREIRGGGAAVDDGQREVAAVAAGGLGLRAGGRGAALAYPVLAAGLGVCVGGPHPNP